MSNQTYTIDEIKAAFWAEFHKSGETWFPYAGPDCEQVTGSRWESFKEYLSQQREEVAETCQKVAEIGREAISKPMERSPAVRGDVVIGTAPIAVMTIGDTTTVMIDPGVSELIIKPGQNIVIRSREKGMVTA